MLRITASGNSAAAKSYLVEGLSRQDYYIDGQEIPGRWGGRAAEMLSLSGDVTKADYFALCENRHPQTGEQLTPRMKDDRRTGYDFTFNAPKSVSVVYSLVDDPHILQAHRDSLLETMRDAETEMKTRVRGNGANEDRVTGNMVWADFTHFTARPVGGVPDPALHTHVFVFNTTWDETEGRWKAGQFGDLKRDATYWESMWHTRFAAKLNALGYGTEKRADFGFEITGVPQSVIDKFSRRRNSIEEKAAERGITDSDGKHAIGYHNREHKKSNLGMGDLREEWRSRLTPAEAEALKDAGRQKGRAVTAEQALQYAVDHSFERVSAISEKRLKAEALRYGVGSVMPEDIDRLMEGQQFIKRRMNGQILVTTQPVLDAETKMLRFARNGHGKHPELGRVEFLPDNLNAEQGAAAAHILHSTDLVTGIRGAAGTGKTHGMKGIVGALEKSGQHVHVFAPSAQASRGVLKSEGFDSAETLERFLIDGEMQRMVRGGVLWVDEAGMVGCRDMQRLFDVAEKHGCRVILSGDYMQHSSVKAGDSFRLLEQEAGVRYAKLQTNRRQKNAAYKMAVDSIAKGTPAGVLQGFDALDKSGAIIEAASDRHERLVADYVGEARGGGSALIVCPTHAEGERLTDSLRAALKADGRLVDERAFMARHSTNWTEAEKRDPRNYRPGLVVEFHQNCTGFKRGEAVVLESGTTALKTDGTRRSLPIENADRYQVYSVHEMLIAKGERVRITKNGRTLGGKRVNNGEIVTVCGFTAEGNISLPNGQVLPKSYGHLAPGYVDTSYASQGKTVDRVYIAAGTASVLAVNSQQWYVSVSRGKESCKVYCDSKDEIREAIARTGKRMSAVELVKQSDVDRRRITRYRKRQPEVQPERQLRRG